VRRAVTAVSAPVIATSVLVFVVMREPQRKNRAGDGRAALPGAVQVVRFFRA
jgi:hypothetical protein